MTKPANTAAFAKSTGRSWEEWLAFLESIGARDLPHKEIARRIVETGDASGWWAQGITVAYEQHIGRRVPGQRNDGRFEVAASRALPATPDEAIALWEKAVEGLPGFDGIAIEGEPERRDTEKWRYWRCALADGTRLTVAASAKTGGGATLTVTHVKLPDAAAKERWRGYWKAFLADL